MGHFPCIKKYQQLGPIKQSQDFRHVFMVNPQPGSMASQTSFYSNILCASAEVSTRRASSLKLGTLGWREYYKHLQAVLWPLYAPKINMKKKYAKSTRFDAIQTCSDMSLPQRMPLVTPGMQETIQTIPASKITHPLTPEDRQKPRARPSVPGEDVRCHCQFASSC